MTKKRLFLELLENKKKVKPDKLYEIYTSPDSEPTSVVSSLKSSYVHDKIEESLLNDLLMSERDLNPKDLKDLNPSPALVTDRPKTPEVAKPPKPTAPTPVAARPPSGAIPKVPVIDPKKQAMKNAEYTIKKQELLVKFDILRKNSERNIPVYNMNHNYSVMKHHYKLLVKQLHIDNKIVFYKQCLLGASGYLEIFMGEAFLGLDMKGYTEFQANSMSNYDKLLLKIGEKSYMPGAVSSMSVEMQLLMTVGMQTAIFVGSKILSNKTGLNVASLFQTATTGASVNLEMPRNK